MIPFEYAIIFIAIVMLGIAVWIKEWVLGFVTGMLFVVVGIYVLSSGLMGLRDYVTVTLGIILICTGLYIMLIAGLERIEETYGGLQ